MNTDVSKDLQLLKGELKTIEDHHNTALRSRQVEFAKSASTEPFTQLSDDDFLKSVVQVMTKTERVKLLRLMAEIWESERDAYEHDRTALLSKVSDLKNTCPTEDVETHRELLEMSKKLESARADWNTIHQSIQKQQDGYEKYLEDRLTLLSSKEMESVST